MRLKINEKENEDKVSLELVKAQNFCSSDLLVEIILITYEAYLYSLKTQLLNHKL